MANLYQSLLSTPALLQTPIIHVKIGEYTFGAYELSGNQARYPNYIQSLRITKINGQVNTYELSISYPITDKDDPNYFEKVFSSVSKTRKIEFEYGDASVPNYLYRNEVGIITNVTSSFNLESSRIDYGVRAVSQAMLGLSGNYSFAPSYGKPSSMLKDILEDSTYGLQDVFSGMSNMTSVEMGGLIPGNDAPVQIEQKENISIIEYMQYLVALMTPLAENDKVAKSSVYILTFDDNTSGDNPGSFFKVTEVDANVSHPEAYLIDIGYPGSNYVMNFNVENDQNYSIIYDYQGSLHPQDYVSRISADGDYESVYAPTVSSSNSQHDTKEDNRAWWAKVTNFPIKASIVIKGLLRPAVLMTYVRLNIYLFGQKHINSGLYIITKLVDTVDGSGYKTELNMTRIGGD